MLRRLIAAVAFVLVVTAARADDQFFRVAVDRLTITEGAWPEAAQHGGWIGPAGPWPYAVLEGSGEAYLTWDESVPPTSEWTPRWSKGRGVLVAKSPAGQGIRGFVFVPDSDGTKLSSLRFTLEASASSPDATTAFFTAKARHFERLQTSGIPGTAWFRYQAAAARRKLPAETPEAPRPPQRPMGSGLDDTYNLFNGGRAVAENLQLHRQLQTAPQEPAEPEELVPVSSIKGITIPEMDWKGRLAGAAPGLDVLAAAIPSDQHGVFFPNAGALAALLKETDEHGLPVYRVIQPRSEDAGVRQRCERQLCISVDQLVAMAGVVQSVAITGSDSYFPTGTDVAVIFQTTSPDELLGALARARSAAAGDAISGTGELDGISYRSLVTPDRTVSSYAAAVGRTVVLTNSLAQLRRLAEVHAGRIPALAGLDEYRWFRQRYPVGAADETAFVFLSDATIRRWCGPEWRIGASRRLRAGAIMADVTAAHMDELAAGTVAAGPVRAETPMRTIGALTLGPGGVASSVYGSASFITPISELAITEVTKDEAAAYGRWRETYQNKWSWAFDPIGISLGLSERRASADLTITPLIIATAYRSWATAAQGATIAPDAGDPHDAMIHGVMAFNKDSAAAKQATGLAGMLSQGREIDYFGWLGQSVALYVDDDPFWAEMLAAENQEEFFERRIFELPIALYAEVSSSIKLTTFLTAARAFIEESSPGMLSWEAMTHGRQGYVKVGLAQSAQVPGRDGFDRISLNYAPTPRALIVSLNEGVLKRAIDRELARHDGTVPKPPALPWLGSSMCLQFGPEGLNLLNGLGLSAEVEGERAWANIPILNEWKRRYPDKDPVQVHQAQWGTRLICPGGGQYEWDPRHQTMFSTVYGSPVDPRKPAQKTAGPLGEVVSGNFGIDFEDRGIRARAVIGRTGR